MPTQQIDPVKSALRPIIPLGLTLKVARFLKGAPRTADSDFIEMTPEQREQSMRNSNLGRGGVEFSNPTGAVDLVLSDKRTINATSGEKIRPNVDSKSGTYNTKYLDELISRSVKLGLSKRDILTMSAMALQETGWGKSNENIGHVSEALQEGKGDDIDSFINAYISKRKLASNLGIKGEAHAIQVYNGTGKLYQSTEKDYHRGLSRKFYGVDVPKEGLDMKVNPLYGVRILDIMDNILTKDKNFMSHFNKKISNK